MKTKLGRQETQMLAYLQMRKRRTVRTGELTGPLQLTRDQERINGVKSLSLSLETTT
jgi:hypothetical protein